MHLPALTETCRAYANTSQYEGRCFARIDVKDHVGLLEWWIDYDYDTLKAMQPPPKPKSLACIMSNNDTHADHKSRLRWLHRFTSRYNLPFDLYGRIKPNSDAVQSCYRGELGRWNGEPGGGHMAGKEQVYLEHKYAIEFDIRGVNYFSERILDAMLLWAMPIYWGCPNLARIRPPAFFGRWT